jgi:hypothetical protein
MKKRWILAIALSVLAASVMVVGQTDPWYRPMSPFGQSLGVGYGTVTPTEANWGAAPANGELFIDMNAAADGGPALLIYSDASTSWMNPAGSLGAGETIIFEGATADAFETTLTVDDPTADHTITLPDDTGAVLTSTLVTNEQQVANSVWGGTNQLIWEGATADAFQTVLQAEDADTGVHTFQLPDNAAAADTYNLVFSVLDTNALHVANSVWMNTNTIVWEGATADAFETILQAQDADVGVHTFQLPDNAAAADTYNLMFSLLDTNALDIANSIWFNTNQMWWEGATENGFEIILTAADSTIADDTYQLPDRAIAADTYVVHATPDGDLTTGYLMFAPGLPESADAVTGGADNVMYVLVRYVPFPITVETVKMTVEGADSAADDTVAVAVYYNADAGAQIAEIQSADQAGAANLNLDIPDFTLQPGFYRFAWCSQDITGADSVSFLLDDQYIDVLNATTVFWGTAANACVAGNPEATTGALTSSDIAVPVIKFE